MKPVRMVECADTGQLMLAVDADLRVYRLTTQHHWTTKEGRRLLPEEFADQHLLNTIAMIERKPTRLVFFEDHIGMMCIKQAYPVYPDLTDEASRRGLR